jgi:hypothetical protein
MQLLQELQEAPALVATNPPYAFGNKCGERAIFATVQLCSGNRRRGFDPANGCGSCPAMLAQQPIWQKSFAASLSRSA